MQALIFRIGALSLAGAAALLAVFSLDGEIEDLTGLLGAAQSESDYQRRASDAASTCGALGAERESCEFALMRLEPVVVFDARSYLAERLGL